MSRYVWAPGAGQALGRCWGVGEPLMPTCPSRRVLSRFPLGTQDGISAAVNKFKGNRERLFVLRHRKVVATKHGGTGQGTGGRGRGEGALRPCRGCLWLLLWKDGGTRPSTGRLRDDASMGQGQRLFCRDPPPGPLRASQESDAVVPRCPLEAQLGEDQLGLSSSGGKDLLPGLGLPWPRWPVSGSSEGGSMVSASAGHCP